MLSERLVELIEPLVVSLGYELVLLEFGPRGRASMLRLFIDTEQGVTIDDCERVSREVAAMLDVEDVIRQAYHLEVSSPGLDRPLTKPAHYLRHAGEQVKIALIAPIQGRRKLTGRLREADECGLKLETDLGVLELAYTAIERAKLVPDYEAELRKSKA